jgi:hypothetical protein
MVSKHVLASHVLLTHYPSLFQVNAYDGGFGYEVIEVAFTFTGIGSLVGRLFWGPACDRFGA